MAKGNKARGREREKKKTNLNEWRDGKMMATTLSNSERHRKNKPPTGSSIIINFNLLSSKRNIKVLGLAWILIDFMRKQIVNFG